MKMILDIFKESGLNIISEEILIEYINFCIKNNTTKLKFQTALHHILPQSANLPFADYADLKLNIWNGVFLSHKHHYIAHSILHKAVDNFFIGSAWHSMNNNKFLISNQKELIGSDLFQILTEKSNKQNSYRMKKWCSTISNNGLTNIQNATIKRIEYQNNKIDENGLNGHQRIAIKSSNTMKQQDENGLSIYDKSIIKMKKTMKLTSHSKGSNNPNAKIILIFDRIGKLQYRCNGNFSEIVEENGLPSAALSKSYKNNGEPIYQTRNAKLIANKHKNLLLIGWYAKIEN